MSSPSEENISNSSQMIDHVDSTTPLFQKLLANTQAAITDSNYLQSSQTAIKSLAVNPKISSNEENSTDLKVIRGDNSHVVRSETSNPNNAQAQMFIVQGQLGFDYETTARRDAIMQHIDKPVNPNDLNNPNHLLAYLEKHPWDADSILWTLNLDATPIYAIKAQGPFSKEVCQQLCEFLGEQTREELERVSIPGYIEGSTRLSNGQVVPVLCPDLCEICS
ncbi:MAG: hypothetical protein V3V18_09900 [Methylococcales bacterium]